MGAKIKKVMLQDGLEGLEINLRYAAGPKAIATNGTPMAAATMLGATKASPPAAIIKRMITESGSVR